MDNYMFPIADCVLFEKYCNLSCEYCFLDKDYRKQIPKSLLTQYYVDLLKCIELAKKKDVDMLKISGGEIFLLSELLDKIIEISGFEKVQILTNGTLTTQTDIMRISQKGNWGLQISLDGHTEEMNFLRFKSKRMFKKVKECLEYSISKALPIEIHMCLNRTNVSNLKSYLEYLVALNGRITLNIIPVREKNERLAVKKEQIGYIEEVIANYNRYEQVLPPKQYLWLLHEMLVSHNKPKEWKCFINKTVLAIQGNGDIKICPEVPTLDTTICGNIFQDSENLLENDYIEKLATSPKNDLLSNHCGRISICKGCFTHYEIINLYINNMIDCGQLRRMWVYDSDRMIYKLNKIKHMYQKEKLLSSNGMRDK